VKAHLQALFQPRHKSPKRQQMAKLGGPRMTQMLPGTNGLELLLAATFYRPEQQREQP